MPPTEPAPAPVAAGASLARTLVVLLLAIVAVAWIAVAAASYVVSRHEAGELLDAHLAQAAALLIAQSPHERDERREHGVGREEHAPTLHRYQQRVAFQVWDAGRTLRLHSADAPSTRLSPRDEGFSDETHDGHRFRVFSRWDERREVLVQVAEGLGARDAIARAAAGTMLWPLAVALPLLALALTIGIRRALRPIAALRQAVEARAPGQLEPLAVAAAPAEVAPLVDGLNRLFARIAALLARERRFTADAAHELRTPLAALKAQAEVARAARDDAERRRALDGVIAGCDRAAHLVDQMLTLARLEPDAAAPQRTPSDLRELARAALADAMPLALRRGMDLTLDDGPAVSVEGDPGQLAILLRNVVDNAVRYGAPSTVVDVRCGRDARGAFVDVRDRGPGLAPAERARLGERFFRAGGSEAPGSGLGVSIARSIAALHGGTLEFAAPPEGPGLVATLRLP